MQETIERHTNSKNLVDILKTEGWLEGLGEIADSPFLVDKNANDVYPSDLIDTVRTIKERKFIQEGIRFLLGSEAISVTYKINRELDLKAGRFVPELDLELRKSADFKRKFFARINYINNPKYITFAQFDIPTKLTELLIQTAYPQI